MFLLMGMILLCSLDAMRLIPILEQGPMSAIPAGHKVHFKETNTDDGTYVFGYDTGVSQQDQSYRFENRSSDGTVTGKYGFITPDGVLREVHYVADSKGYRYKVCFRST